MKVVALKGSQANLAVVMANMAEMYPGARSGVVIVFDDAGAMHTQWAANAQQMALAGARLLHLANQD